MLKLIVRCYGNMTLCNDNDKPHAFQTFLYMERYLIMLSVAQTVSNDWIICELERMQQESDVA